ncbi:MAG: hypothetical protein JRF45_15780 [Deltaproteobacteria bacterium]|nr:hypothetical protein [Deltaproteobacteria bacterium]MBW2198384.1 hypothetical protein [Deltaproteobacteria bacterium]MBW2327894.1 hypothetical protein [Deltaproteobacteria bacterium]
MSITPGYIFIFKAGLKKEKSTYCGFSFNRFAGFCEPASLMNEGDSKDREYWVQIITTIPEISSTDHSRNQTTDKRIILQKS